MTNWTRFKDHRETTEYFRGFGKRFRSGELGLGKGSYAPSLAIGVWQAIHCGYEKLAAVEFGVAAGNGLLDLCKAAEHFRTALGLEILVYGIDNIGDVADVVYEFEKELVGARLSFVSVDVDRILLQNTLLKSLSTIRTPIYLLCRSISTTC